MVKKGNKDFKSGLDMIIQSTVINEESETSKDFKVEAATKRSGQVVAKEKEKQMTFTMPESLKRNIKKYCAANDVTIRELLINSVSSYMKINE